MKIFGNHLSVLKISGKCNEICNKKHFFGELPFDAIHYQSCYSNSQLKTFAFCLCSPCSHFFFVVDIKVSANARFLQSLCKRQEDLPKLRAAEKIAQGRLCNAMNYMSPLLVQNFISPSALVSVIM